MMRLRQRIERLEKLLAPPKWKPTVAFILHDDDTGEVVEIWVDGPDGPLIPWQGPLPPHTAIKRYSKRTWDLV